MKKTLVIHPSDRSTDFLREIYVGKLQGDIIQEGRSPNTLYREMAEAERIIMLGHGFPGGLFGHGFDRGLVITDFHSRLLNTTKDNIYIWCNADKFVNKHKLKGFYSGMFISEVEEAAMYGIEATQEQIDNSNNCFAKLLGDVVNKTTKEIYNYMKKTYVSETCEVIQFNNERLYYRD